VAAGSYRPTKGHPIRLQNAASIAGLMVTTECMVTEIPGEEKDPSHVPAGTAMGHVLDRRPQSVPEPFLDALIRAAASVDVRAGRAAIPPGGLCLVVPDLARIIHEGHVNNAGLT